MGLFGGGRGLFGGGGGLLGGGSSNGFSSGGFSSRVVRDDSEIMREFVKQSDTLAGEFLRTVDDAKDEFHELCTDGFIEMVIKGNSNYKTSFEIRDEADEKIGKARGKYQERCNKFNKYLDALNNRINDLYKKKVEIAKKLNQTVSTMPNMPRVSRYLNSPIY